MFYYGQNAQQKADSKEYYENAIKSMVNMM